MRIFAYSDYKKYVLDVLLESRGQGRGQFTKIAEKLGVGKAFVTHVFRGERDLEPDQAIKLSSFLKLGKLESRFFIQLVNFARATDPDLKEMIQMELDELKKRALGDIDNAQDKLELSEAEKSLYYSDWRYSAVHVLSSIESLGDLDALAAHLDLSKERTKDIVDFLVSIGFCSRDGKKVRIETRRAKSNPGEPSAIRHAHNWRARALDQLGKQELGTIHYSFPQSISQADYERVRLILLKAIEEVRSICRQTTPETGACLNIDWFKI